MRLWSSVGLLSCWAATASAQDGLIDVDEGSPDPIGTSPSSCEGFVPPPVFATPPVVEGPVLTAIGSVREGDHEVLVRLFGGLARVEVTMRFENRARVGSEVRYRLAIPEGAGLESVSACAIDESSAPDACREVTSPSVERRQDNRGDALLIRAGPVPARGELQVRVAVVAPTTWHGGVARLALPPRGTDSRIVAADIRVDAPRLVSPTVDGTAADHSAVRIEPWAPALIAARAPAGSGPRTAAYRVPCGNGSCHWMWAGASMAAGSPVDLVLAIDVSPSTQGPARGRIAPAIAALLGLCPAGSRVRALAFAARAQALIESPVEAQDAPLVPLAEATMPDLGRTTRFEAAWEMARMWLGQRTQGLRPLIVVFGDGGLSANATAHAAMSHARLLGIEVSVVNVANRRTVETLANGALRTGGAVIDAGMEADRAVRGHGHDGSSMLEERLAAVFAPRVAPSVSARLAGNLTALGTLRAGESISWHTAGRRSSAALRLNDRWIPATAAPTDVARGLAEMISLSTSLPRPSPPDVEGRGIPAETVLALLRRQLVPVARQCLRDDRAGRPGYSVRAEYHLALAEQEVITSEVRGTMRSSLRRCLHSAVDALDVPLFSGTVVVRYPIYTEAEEPPPVVQLSPLTNHAVNHVIGAPIALPEHP